MATAQKSFYPKPGATRRNWHLIDAKDQVLGRLSTRIAKILTGKTKPIYTPSVDCGDFVIAVNVGKIKLTGNNKLTQKVAFRHSARPGGAKVVPYEKLMEEKPEHALFLAVKRMLPKNKLASRQILRLKMYKGATHPHAVQQPAALDLTTKA